MLRVIMFEPFQNLCEGVGIGVEHDIVGCGVVTLRQTMGDGMVEVMLFHQSLHLSQVIALTHEQEFLLPHIIHDDFFLFFFLMELLSEIGQECLTVDEQRHDSKEEYVVAEMLLEEDVHGFMEYNSVFV